MMKTEYLVGISVICFLALWNTKQARKLKAFFPTMDGAYKGTNWTHDWLVNRLHGEPARILLVHVGKTGGQSLKDSIPLWVHEKRDALGCLMNRTKYAEDSGHKTSLEQEWAHCFIARKPEPALGKHILAHKHIYSATFKKGHMEWVVDNVNTFLITTRNPVARIVSAFNFHRHSTIQHINDTRNEKKRRPSMKFYLDCFPNVDAVANSLIASRNKTTPGACVDLAKAILQGKGPAGDRLLHFHFNYHYYANFTMDQNPDAAVVVVRTEHLWDDTRRLDFALGGDGKFAVQSHVSHGSEKYQVRSGITTLQGQIGICCEIAADIAEYQRIIFAAVNLNHEDKIETLNGAFEECGIQYSKDPVKHPFSWVQWQRETCDAF